MPMPTGYGPASTDRMPPAHAPTLTRPSPTRTMSRSHRTTGSLTGGIPGALRPKPHNATHTTGGRPRFEGGLVRAYQPWPYPPENAGYPCSASPPHTGDPAWAVGITVCRAGPQVDTPGLSCGLCSLARGRGHPTREAGPAARSAVSFRCAVQRGFPPLRAGIAAIAPTRGATPGHPPVVRGGCPR